MTTIQFQLQNITQDFQHGIKTPQITVTLKKITSFFSATVNKREPFHMMGEHVSFTFDVNKNTLQIAAMDYEGEFDGVREVMQLAVSYIIYLAERLELDSIMIKDCGNYDLKNALLSSQFEEKNQYLELKSKEVLFFERAEVFNKLKLSVDKIIIEFPESEFKMNDNSMEIEFYFNGLNGKVSLRHTPEHGICLIDDNSNEILAADFNEQRIESIKEKLLSILETLADQSQVERIINPPRKYFNQFIFDIGVHQSKYDLIFNELSKYIKPEEMDLFIRKSTFREKSTNSVTLFQIGQFSIVIDKHNNSDFISISTDFEQATSVFKEKNLEIFLEQLDTTINSMSKANFIPTKNAKNKM